MGKLRCIKTASKHSGLVCSILVACRPALQDSRSVSCAYPTGLQMQKGSRNKKALPLTTTRQQAQPTVRHIPTHRCRPLRWCNSRSAATWRLRAGSQRANVGRKPESTRDASWSMSSFRQAPATPSTCDTKCGSAMSTCGRRLSSASIPTGGNRGMSCCASTARCAC